MIFSGRIQDGKFKPDDSEFKIKLRRLENKPVYLEIKKIDKTRSTSHNAYYWLLLGIAEEETGMAKEELHSYFKIKTWGYIEYGGEKLPPNSHDKTTVEFMRLVQTVKDFFTENGWIIPEYDRLGTYAK